TNLVTEERTRAVVSASELRALAPDRMGDALEHVIQNLARARLLLIEADAAGAAMVELAHESLIEHWPRLRQWLDEDEDEAQFRARLRAAAREWDQRGRMEELLWRGALAAEAGRWQAHWRAQADDHSSTGGFRRTVELGDRDQQFLHAVVAVAARVRRRRRQVAGAAFALLGAVAVVVSVLAVQANRAAARADEQARYAQERSDEAIQQADRALQQAIRARNATRMAVARENQADPTLAFALVRELEPAHPRGGQAAPNTAPGRWRELAQWAMHQGVARMVLEHPDTVESAAFSPDGTRIVTASSDNAARVWNADGSGQPVVLRGHLGTVRSAAFSRDGTRIVTASSDQTARVWNADGSGQPVVLRGHL
ncbi:MAG: protein kinase, partial [Proteobacteria bacterium]|nr:protein kinase [Pseudomonadota bacterium]